MNRQGNLILFFLQLETIIKDLTDAGNMATSSFHKK